MFLLRSLMYVIFLSYSQKFLFFIKIGLWNGPFEKTKYWQGKAAEIILLHSKGYGWINFFAFSHSCCFSSDPLGSKPISSIQIVLWKVRSRSPRTLEYDADKLTRSTVYTVKNGVHLYCSKASRPFIAMLPYRLEIGWYWYQRNPIWSKLEKRRFQNQTFASLFSIAQKCGAVALGRMAA